MTDPGFCEFQIDVVLASNAARDMRTALDENKGPSSDELLAQACQMVSETITTLLGVYGDLARELLSESAPVVALHPKEGA